MGKYIEHSNEKKNVVKCMKLIVGNHQEKDKDDNFTMSRMERFLEKLDKQLENSLK